MVHIVDTRIGRLCGIVSPHALREQGLCDWGWCPFIYVCVCVCDKKLNGTLAVNSPFQTLAVDFSSNL